jgi:hypothetical protein
MNLKDFFRAASLLIFFGSSHVLVAQDNDDFEEEEESEFAEPIFFDTSTDIGGDAKELEVNYVPSIEIDNGVNFLNSSFEFEYVVFKNFGIEFEPGFTTIFKDGAIQTGLNDFEIETQYTFKANNRFGFAGGLEFGIPVGDRDLELSEGVIEIEPFVTTVHKTNFGLSIHPRVSLGIETFELDQETSESEIEEGGLEYIGSCAFLYTYKNVFIGTEISAIYEGDLTTIITPQIGITINDLFVGGGIQFFQMDGNSSFGAIGRIIYEFEFGDD